MARTTLDLDASVLRELKRLQRTTDKTLGQLVSELVSGALARMREASETREASPAWISRPMGARVDLEDKEALRAALEDE
jgi:hypothetical protein